jgi:hypothetical protein
MTKGCVVGARKDNTIGALESTSERVVGTDVTVRLGACTRVLTINAICEQI